MKYLCLLIALAIVTTLPGSGLYLPDETSGTFQGNNGTLETKYGTTYYGNPLPCLKWTGPTYGDNEEDAYTLWMWVPDQEEEGDGWYFEITDTTGIDISAPQLAMPLPPISDWCMSWTQMSTPSGPKYIAKVYDGDDLKATLTLTETSAPGFLVSTAAKRAPEDPLTRIPFAMILEGPWALGCGKKMDAMWGSGIFCQYSETMECIIRVEVIVLSFPPRIETWEFVLPCDDHWGACNMDSVGLDEWWFFGYPTVISSTADFDNSPADLVGLEIKDKPL